MFDVFISLIFFIFNFVQNRKITQKFKKNCRRNNCIEKNLIFAAQKITNKNYTKMYAIVEIAGQQFKVEKDRRVYVQRLKAEEGAQVTFDRVMLVDNDGDVKVGTPTVSGAAVTATVLQHLKGDKVLVFKKKRRKGYQKLNGHRQCLTSIKIDNIAL